MKIRLKTQEEITAEIEQIHKEIQPALYESAPGITQSVEEIKIHLNSRILKIITLIRNKHPELNKYLDELPITIPNLKEPEISVDSLMNYYDSLKTLLKQYSIKHPDFTSE